MSKDISHLEAQDKAQVERETDRNKERQRFRQAEREGEAETQTKTMTDRPANKKTGGQVVRLRDSSKYERFRI